MSKLPIKIDEATWRHLVSLDHDNPGFMFDLLTLCLESIPDLLLELKSNAKTPEFKNVSQFAHILKSNCGSVGALEIAEKLDRVESLAQQSVPVVDINVLESVCNEVNLLVTELEMRKSNFGAKVETKKLEP